MSSPTDTQVLIKAMRRLADDIHSDDGVANAAIEEAADRLTELERENAALRRDVYQCPPTSENDYEGFKWNDACEELEQENAALREALVLIANGAESAKGIAKVALGKEAQP